MLTQSLYQTFKRYKSLHTHVISTLPIAILMPHSACNCRCVMCDIWKGNKNLKQLTQDDIRELLKTFERLNTQMVLMSGGEALLNPNFFRLCEILKEKNLRISLLSTGLTLKKHAKSLIRWVDDIIVSLDGDATTHDAIRNIPGAYDSLKEGVQYLKNIRPGFRITSRTVIHKQNFRKWPDIIESAKDIGIDQVSFLPADVSSQAFNRQTVWNEERRDQILPAEEELGELENITEHIIQKYIPKFEDPYFAETPAKLRKIYAYYAAFYGLNPFPFKKCNAPWVSAVVEADGNVRPCFFHDVFGNIHQQSLHRIINSAEAIKFRKTLDMQTNDICKKCVCHLDLSPGTNLRKL
ncbi:MAG TPA: radical SAM protein [Chitinophagaceae bacterium]|nr:radical SAM protein [Chitinophagaceae bacterium]